MPLQGASLIAFIPRAAPWVFVCARAARPVRAKALHIAEDFHFFIRRILKLLPLQGALLIVFIPRALPWARSFCPFRACCCGLLDHQCVAAYIGFWAFMALLLWLLIIQHALLYGCNYPARPFVRLKLPSTPSCMVEFTQYTLLYC